MLSGGGGALGALAAGRGPPRWLGPGSPAGGALLASQRWPLAARLAAVVARSPSGQR